MTELERDLRGLATMIEFPETPEIASNVCLVPRRARSWRRGVALVTAVIVLAVIAGLAVPQARTAILRLLGIGGVRIEFVDRLPRVQPSGSLDLGTPIDPSEAPFRVLRPALLGEPDAVYRRGDVVTLLYGAPVDVRVLVTEISDSGFTPDIGKHIAASGTRVEFVAVRGAVGAAVWITGRTHTVRLPGGRPRLAANTLIWMRGPLTIRLEGAASLEQALAIAASLK